jgi:hypothetical protein
VSLYFSYISIRVTGVAQVAAGGTKTMRTAGIIALFFLFGFGIVATQQKIEA